MHSDNPWGWRRGHRSRGSDGLRHGLRRSGGACPALVRGEGSIAGHSSGKGGTVRRRPSCPRNGGGDERHSAGCRDSARHTHCHCHWTAARVQHGQQTKLPLQRTQRWKRPGPSRVVSGTGEERRGRWGRALARSPTSKCSERSQFLFSVEWSLLPEGGSHIWLAMPAHC